MASPGRRMSPEEFAAKFEKPEDPKDEKVPFIDYREDGPFLVDPRRGIQVGLPVIKDLKVVKIEDDFCLTSPKMPPRALDQFFEENSFSWSLGLAYFQGLGTHLRRDRVLHSLGLI